MELKLVDIGSIPADTMIRGNYDQSSYLELKTSIAKVGILFPIVVSKIGKEYRLVDGYLRLKAAGELSRDEKIPVLEIKATESQVVETALIVNAVRENLDSVSLGEAVNLLVNRYKNSAVEVAESIGKSQQYVRRLLKVFMLPPHMLKALRAGEITVAHAHQLTKLSNNPKALSNVFEKALKDDLAYRDLETLVAGYLQKDEKKQSDYTFFSPKVVTTKAGSRLRFEPRRNSIRLELNLLHTDFDAALDEVKRQLEALRKKHLKAVS